ncbi:hypothetical protein ACHAWF_011262 [Thalassiosira exigua]
MAAAAASAAPSEPPPPGSVDGPAAPPSTTTAAAAGAASSASPLPPSSGPSPPPRVAPTRVAPSSSGEAPPPSSAAPRSPPLPPSASAPPSSSSSSSSISPLMAYVDVDPNERMPPPPPPSRDAELTRRAEETVRGAVLSRRNGANGGDDRQEAHQSRLIDTLRRKPSPPELLATLEAISSTDAGMALDDIATRARAHARLVHCLTMLDPFVPSAAGAEGLRRVEAARGERRKRAAREAAAVGGGRRSPMTVRIAEPSLRLKEDAKHVAPPMPYFRYQVADAHLRLLVGLASHNAVLSLSVVRSLWGRLTEFGTRWTEWWRGEAERARRGRRTRERIEERTPEGERPVPGAAGLSVEFYRDALCRSGGGGDGDDDDEGLDERGDVGWDRLPGGRSFACRRANGLFVRSERGRGGAALFGSLRLDEVAERRRKAWTERRIGALLSLGTSPGLGWQVPGRLSPEPCDVPVSFGWKGNRGKDVPRETTWCNPSELHWFFGSEARHHDGTSVATGMASRDPQRFQGESPTLDIFASLSSAAYQYRHLNRQRFSTTNRVRRLLLALANVLRLCPRAKPDLLREMSDNFPHHRTCPPAAYAWYVRQCLQAVRLAPSLEGPVLGLLVDKALDMDVEIKIGEGGSVALDAAPREEEDDGEEASESSPPLGTKKRSFHRISRESLVGHGAAAAAGGAPRSGDSAPDEADRVREVSERLDALMAALIDHVVRATTFSPDSLPSAARAVLNARRLHRRLEDVFDGKVRTTDRAKFVQFVLFVLFGRENDALECFGRALAERERRRQEGGSTDDASDAVDPDAGPIAPINPTEPLYRKFCAGLINLLYDPGHHAGDAPRQTVVCYLASFVARATYVCPETACKCVTALLRWAEAYLVERGAGAGPPAGGVKGAPRRLSSAASLGNDAPRRAHTLFYTVCQAAFYIVCFRGAEVFRCYREALHGKDDPSSHCPVIESVDVGPSRWRPLCEIALRPLAHCLGSVREEFLRVAEDLDVFLLGSEEGGSGAAASQREEAATFLAMLWDLSSAKRGGPDKAPSLGAKRRWQSSNISTAATREKRMLDSGVAGLGRGSNPLDYFFLFDPYLLSASHGHLGQFYRGWEDCVPTAAGDEEKEEAEEHPKDGGDRDNDGVMLDDAQSEVNNLEDEDECSEDREERNQEEEEEEAEEDSDDEKEKDGEGPSVHLGLASFSDEKILEMKLRRSRAMSTGSQCSS